MMYENIYEALKYSDDYLFRLIREVYLRGVEDGGKAVATEDSTHIFHDWASIELAIDEPVFDPEDFVDKYFNQRGEL